MIRSLRKLLIAPAVLATILAGVQSSLGENRPLETGVSKSNDRGHDGSREDDSGTRSEQVGEDESEEQDDRELHLFATSELCSTLNGDVACLPSAMGHATPRTGRRSSLGRGPPAAL